MNKRRILKILLALSILTGCSSNQGLTPETLILTQPSRIETTVFTSEFISETWEEGDMPDKVYADYEQGMSGIQWIATYVEGKKATVTEEYIVTYNQNGDMISKTPIIGSRITTEAVAPKMQFGGSVTKGSEFFPKMYTYGVDCAGCNISESGVGGTSAGISISKTAVKQKNGEWVEGIKYGDYYIVAADPSIPLCSTLMVYEHGFSGEGLTPNKPFKAIVLDRGGAIRGSELDLFIGTEKNSQVKNKRNTTVKVVITRVGGRDGKKACKL